MNSCLSNVILWSRLLKIYLHTQLVAGAVIATIYENVGSGSLDIDRNNDTRLVMFGKRLTRLLLLSAFAFEVLSIFVTTVTGNMLLSHTEASLDAMMPSKMVNKYSTPLSFLHDNFEFEYLSKCFLVCMQTKAVGLSTYVLFQLPQRSI